MLDEDALEAMLARGRAATTEKAEMVTTDETAEFEVYERKDEPEPEVPVAPPEPEPIPETTDEFEVFERQPTPEPIPEPVTAPAVNEEFEVYGEEPELVPEPEPVAAPKPSRRPEVWPPIGRSHAPESTPAPAPAPEPAPAAQTTDNPTAHNHAALPRHGGGARVAIVQCMFNGELTDMMADLASRQVTKHNGEVVAHLQCPGVYDVPLPTKQLLARDDVDAVVVIGVVVQGETKHDELITHATAKTLQELSLQFDKPVGMGITGPGMTWKQAEARVVNGAHAVDAVMQLVA